MDLGLVGRAVGRGGSEVVEDLEDLLHAGLDVPMEVLPEGKVLTNCSRLLR